MKKLTQDELRTGLARLPEWIHDRGTHSIHREFVCGNFMQAFAFMTEMAIWSEKHDHHPEWRNVYKRVDITLSTHDVGGLSELDLQWAAQADAIFARGASTPC